MDRYNSYTIQRDQIRFQKERRASSESQERNRIRRGGRSLGAPLFYYLDQRIDAEDEDGEFLHLVTLWKATHVERMLYEETS